LVLTPAVHDGYHGYTNPVAGTILLPSLKRIPPNIAEIQVILAFQKIN
jgi:hypothetical protein